MNAQQVPHGGGLEFERWSEAMRGEFDEFRHETWQAMNKARTGYWIADTEEVMRQARDRLGRRAYENLLQLRLDAGEAGGEAGSGGPGAFSPSRLRAARWAEQGPQADHAFDGRGAG